jgi:hypothetical protein
MEELKKDLIVYAQEMLQRISLKNAAPSSWVYRTLNSFSNLPYSLGENISL